MLKCDKLLKKLNLPLPNGFFPSSEIEWTHPFLIFMAEHSRIPKNSLEEDKSIIILNNIVKKDFIYKLESWETLVSNHYY